MKPEARRLTFIGLLIATVLVLFVAALVTLLGLPSTRTWLIVCAVALAAIVVGEAVLLFLAKREDEWEDWADEDGGGVEELLLRCASCREVFPVEDDGRRPLRHTCPHCGRSGILRDSPPPKRAHYGPGFHGRSR